MTPIRGSLFFIIAVLQLVQLPTAATVHQTGLAGQWQGSLELRQGSPVEVRLLIESDPWKVEMKLAGVTLSARNVIVEGGRISFALDLRGVPLQVEGSLEASHLAGKVIPPADSPLPQGQWKTVRQPAGTPWEPAETAASDGSLGLWGGVQHEQRGSSRLVYYVATAADRYSSSPGQIMLHYGQPKYRKAFSDLVESMPPGRAWRLGANFWATLDVGIPVRLGETEVPMGSYYCLLERREDSGWNLLLVDIADMHGKGLDAWHADKRPLPEGRRSPLAQVTPGKPSDQLIMQFRNLIADGRQFGKVPAGSPGPHAVLEITFGPLGLSVPVRVDFGQ